MPKGICPECGLLAELHVFAAQTDINPALAEALGMPASLGTRVTAYLRLFSPPKKTLTTTKALRLLSELRAAIAAGQVERHGRAWPAPVNYWQMALDELLDKRDRLALPLKSHGYLFEMVAGMSSRAAAKAETQKEERLRRPAPPQDPKRPAVIGTRAVDRIVEENMRRLQALTKKEEDPDAK